MTDPYKSLRKLIDLKGKEKDPVKFHRSVNEVFHNIEAEFYDTIHVNMWESLPEIFDIISKEVLIRLPDLQYQNLKLLDIGSGTGLSTELFLQTELGKSIEHVTMLDSSSVMIAKSKQRSINWAVTSKEFINGYIEDIGDLFDIIICSSLLHHIPDLNRFLSKVGELQKTGGLFIHLQDPNALALNSPSYKERNRIYKEFKAQKQKDERSLYVKIVGGLYRIKKRILGTDYISRVNKELKKQHIIRKNLSASEIWSITDIHVENLPYSIGAGINLDQIDEYLKNYSQIFHFTYSFFGPLSYELPENLKNEEKKLICEGDQLGRNIAGIWTKANGN